MLAVYLQLAPALKAGNALDIARRAQDAGYDTILAWDSPHQFTPQDPVLEKGAREFAAGVRAAGLKLWVQVASTGRNVQNALGASVMERGQSGDDAVICLAEPRIWPLWEKWAERCRDWFAPDGVLIAYDEMRAAGTHKRCRAAIQAAGGPGHLLAVHARKATALHRRVLGKPVAVFSDMFSPSENAGPGDYKGNYPPHVWNVHGGWSGSWEGLDPEVLILNWSFDEESLRWFQGRGHRQIYCGDYDFPSDGIGLDKERAQIAGLLDGDIPLAGYARFTWSGNYDLERLKAYLPSPEMRTRIKSEIAALAAAPEGAKT